LAVLGGSFNPPHLGHYGMAQVALSSGAVGRVLLVPCAVHVFGKKLASFAHRIEMCRLLVEENPDMGVSDIESRMGSSGRTLDMLRALQSEVPGVSLRLLVGADIWMERHRWYGFEEIEKLAPPLYVARRGVPPVEVETLEAPMEVSSRQIRRMLADGLSPAGVVSPRVLEYIHAHGIYGDEQ
jgi:nicotinate-nucleotide adenylyltransferase